MKKDCDGKPCFFCRKPIEGEGVQWDETNNWAENPDGDRLIHLYLHGKCAIDLGARLIGDGHANKPAGRNPERIRALVDMRLRG